MSLYLFPLTLRFLCVLDKSICYSMWTSVLFTVIRNIMSGIRFNTIWWPVVLCFLFCSLWAGFLLDWRASIRADGRRGRARSHFVIQESRVPGIGASLALPWVSTYGKILNFHRRRFELCEWAWGSIVLKHVQGCEGTGRPAAGQIRFVFLN